MNGQAFGDLKCFIKHGNMALYTYNQMSLNKAFYPAGVGVLFRPEDMHCDKSNGRGKMMSRQRRHAKTAGILSLLLCFLLVFGTAAGEAYAAENRT